MSPGDEESVDGIIGRPDGFPAGEAQDFAGTTTAEPGMAHRGIESGPAPDTETVAGPGPKSVTASVHDQPPPYRGGWYESNLKDP
jgi:hypothetical protein